MLAIIQARSNSKRFKKKVLYPIQKKPLIEYVYKRVSKSNKIKKIIVSTSKNKSDNDLVNFLKKKKISYYRGSLNNVALRLLETAIKYRSKYFVRISADSPVIDYKIINKAIDIQQSIKKKFDLITNTFPRSFPKGQSVEIIKTNTLKKNIRYFTKTQKEHVTLYFYVNSKNFMIKNFSQGKKKLENQAVDTKMDLKRILKKYKKSFYI